VSSSIRNGDGNWAADRGSCTRTERLCGPLKCEAAIQLGMRTFRPLLAYRPLCPGCRQVSTLSRRSGGVQDVQLAEARVESVDEGKFEVTMTRPSANAEKLELVPALRRTSARQGRCQWVTATQNSWSTPSPTRMSELA